MSRASAPSEGRVVGARLPRIDALARIRGEARFVADMTLPRMVHAAFARSPHAHARIVAVDVSEALAVPGVVGALTGEDVPTRYGAIPVAQDETALALRKVRYIGEPVACIAALDVETARRAAALVRVTYEVLPSVLGVDAALDPSSPILHDEARKPSNVLRAVSQTHGDLESAFAASDVVVEHTYDYPGSTHVPLEAHAALAHPESDGTLTLWTSTQNVHYVHKDVARVLGLEERQLRVVKPAVGAGYGGKCDPFCTEICASALALRLGRPVRAVLSREEVFYAHRGRHPTRMWLKMGLSRDGTLRAIDFKAWADGGAYASYGVVTSYYLGVFMTMPYRMDAYRFEAMRLYTNVPPCGPKRGHGAIQPRYALEEHLDRAAEVLGMAPDELRRRNLLGPDTDTLNGLRITSNGVAACLERVLTASRYAERRGQLGPGRGLGLALSAYMSGAMHPIHASDLPQSAVLLKIDRSGEIVVYSGSADLGQGSIQMLAGLVAERLGRAPSVVRVVEGDTRLTPVDLGSYSSRVTMFAGNAALAAADALRARLALAVHARLGCRPEDVQLRDGRLYGTGDTSHEVSFLEACHAAEAAHGALVTTGSYNPPRHGSRFRRQSVGPSPAYSFTAQVAEVEVDEETGSVRVVDVWVAHDCGRALNPQIVEGQVEGCVAMGVGEALTEEQTYRGGQLRAPSLLSYATPSIHETPRIHVQIVETHDPEGPLGAKECGEGPQLGTVPAIANAIHDAVGVWMTKPPFTPERVLRALDAKARA